MPATLDSSTIMQLQEARVPALELCQGDIRRVCRRRRAAGMRLVDHPPQQLGKHIGQGAALLRQRYYYVRARR
ncbi:hypothetical protein OR61_23060, partial [Xanthomonas vesicatoria]